MSFVSKQELLDLKKTNPNITVYNYGLMRHMGEMVYAKNITEEKADEILSSALRETLAVHQAKINRPWEIIDLTAALDAKQPWIGFEFEMGFNAKSDYDKLINHLWHNTNHVAIDREGYGEYCPEVTFSPENLAGYMNGSSTIHGVIKWMNDNKVKLADFGDAYIGTHLNLSTPAYRKGNPVHRQRYASLVNNSILTLTQAEHVELFGRKPFGLGTPQAGGWVEYKMFKSTDDMKAFNKYVEVAKNMAELMEYMMANPSIMPLPAANRRSAFIMNFADILRGKASAKSVEFREVSDEGILAATGGNHWRGRHGATFPDARKRALPATLTTEVIKKYAY